MENRRPEVVDGAAVLDGVVAIIFGGAVDRRPFTPPPDIQILKSNRLWSRPLLPWENGVRPNSPAQMTSVSSRIPRAFRSFSRAAMGWSTCAAMARCPSSSAGPMDGPGDYRRCANQGNTQTIKPARELVADHLQAGGADHANRITSYGWR